MADIHRIIKHDFQIKKFCLYGFFKNLKFFEPYLLIYLLGLNINLFQIGLLFSIRGIITFVFEIPSGIIADMYGKKKELLTCFIFYIIAFTLFFISSSFLMISLGMIFWGLGEAFRSGTHKAMILSYLEQKNWYSHKNFVYGNTRSYSLLGSSISSFVSIIFILQLPAMRWIFIVSTIPYILDFLLILSYPSSLDGPEYELTRHHKLSNILKLSTFKNFYHLSVTQLKELNKNLKLKKVLSSSAIFASIFSTIKDYIQPILILLFLSRDTGLLLSFTENDMIKIYLGVLYGIFYIFSSISTRNIYRLANRFGSHRLFDWFFVFLGVLLFLLSITIHFNYMYLTILLFFILYNLKDSRRPLFLDVASNYMAKHQRATSLSIESQFKSILLIIIAPLFGWIADTFSISLLFLIIAVSVLSLQNFLIIKD